MDYDFHVNNVFLPDKKKFGNICLRQIGRLYCRSETEIFEHIQPPDLYELTIATDGSGTVYTNGIATQIQRGDIYLSFPLDAHRIISDANKPLKYDFFAFTIDDCELKKELKRITNEYHSPLSRVIRDERIMPLLANAIVEIDGKNYQAEDLLSAAFKLIVIYTIRAFQELTPTATLSPDATENEILCYKLMNYIDTHIHSLKKLSDLSKITDYSYGYLSTVFKKTTSTSLLSYFQNKKLDVARLLILEGKLTITEISEMLNYSSVYALSKAFSKQYGMSPRAYKIQAYTNSTTNISEST